VRDRILGTELTFLVEFIIDLSQESLMHRHYAFHRLVDKVNALGRVMFCPDFIPCVRHDFIHFILNCSR